MDYALVKTIHFFSVLMLFVSLGMIAVGIKSKFTFILHGLSWLIVFISAFQLVSILELHENFPKWAQYKTIIWVILGLSVFALTKKVKWSIPVMTMISILGFGAIWLAVAKPNF